MRQMQIAEEAAAVSQLYQDREYEAWLGEVSKKGAALLAGKSTKA